MANTNNRQTEAPSPNTQETTESSPSVQIKPATSEIVLNSEISLTAMQEKLRENQWKKIETSNYHRNQQHIFERKVDNTTQSFIVKDAVMVTKDKNADTYRAMLEAFSAAHPNETLKMTAINENEYNKVKMICEEIKANNPEFIYSITHREQHPATSIATQLEDSEDIPAPTIKKKTTAKKVTWADMVNPVSPKDASPDSKESVVDSESITHETTNGRQAWVDGKKDSALTNEKSSKNISMPSSSTAAILSSVTPPGKKEDKKSSRDDIKIAKQRLLTAKKNKKEKHLDLLKGKEEQAKEKGWFSFLKTKAINFFKKHPIIATCATLAIIAAATITSTAIIFASGGAAIGIAAAVAVGVAITSGAIGAVAITEHRDNKFSKSSQELETNNTNEDKINHKARVNEFQKAYNESKKVVTDQKKDLKLLEKTIKQQRKADAHSANTPINPPENSDTSHRFRP